MKFKLQNLLKKMEEFKDVPHVRVISIFIAVSNKTFLSVTFVINKMSYHHNS